MEQSRGSIESRTRFDDWHAIETLIFTYAECVDTARFNDAAALFKHSTYRRDLGGGRIETHRGAAEVAAYMSHTPVFPDGSPRTRHVNTNLIIELDGDTATSRNYFTVFQQTATLPLQPIAMGRYVDKFEFVDGRWRFCDRLMCDAMVGNISEHSKR
jgi:hypothetical protein